MQDHQNQYKEKSENSFTSADADKCNKPHNEQQSCA